MPKATLDAKQLAELLHLKPYTVTDYTIRHPEWLPPFIKLPTGKTIWFEDDVNTWLEEHRIKVLPPQKSPTDFSHKWW